MALTGHRAGAAGQRNEQAHSSEINITDATRYVLTARFTVGRPRYSRVSAGSRTTTPDR